MNERVKVLFLAANPVHPEVRLRTDKEAREIQAEVERAVDRDRFEIATVFALRQSDLQRALLRHRPQIVHFSGHGSAGEGIYLEDDAGRARVVSGDALAATFKPLKGIRVV